MDSKGEEYVSRSTTVRAVILVPLLVFTLVAAFFALGYLMTIIFRIPFSLGFSFPLRLLGLLLLALGFLFLGWLFKYRKPLDVIVSTYVTFRKAGGRKRLEERSGRTEPLIVRGPYRHVRHPLYFGVVVLLFGWWLLLDYSFLMVSAILLLAWFNFVVTRFEEQELSAIFGEQYEQYAREAPRMIPFTKRYKKHHL